MPSLGTGSGRLIGGGILVESPGGVLIRIKVGNTLQQCQVVLPTWHWGSQSVRLRWHRPRGVDRGFDPRVLKTKVPPRQRPVAARLAGLLEHMSSGLGRREREERGAVWTQAGSKKLCIGEEPGGVWRGPGVKHIGMWKLPNKTWNTWHYLKCTCKTTSHMHIYIEGSQGYLWITCVTFHKFTPICMLFATLMLKMPVLYVIPRYMIQSNWPCSYLR